MDTVSPAMRSRIMANVKSRGNKSTEAALAELFRKERIFGWRRNYNLAGKPDFVFPALKLAVFVDGCFWHGCPKHGRIPASNRKYWKQKIERNAMRDKSVVRGLRGAGWHVARFWEHDLSDRHRLAAKTKRIKAIINAASVS